MDRVVAGDAVGAEGVETTDTALHGCLQRIRRRQSVTAMAARIRGHQRLAVAVQEIDAGLGRQAGLLARARQPVEPDGEADHREHMAGGVLHRTAIDQDRLLQYRGEGVPAQRRLAGRRVLEPRRGAGVAGLPGSGRAAHRMPVDIEQGGDGIGRVGADRGLQHLFASIEIDIAEDRALDRRVAAEILGDPLRLPDQVALVAGGECRIALDGAAGLVDLASVMLDRRHDAERRGHQENNGEQERQAPPQRAEIGTDHRPPRSL